MCLESRLALTERLRQPEYRYDCVAQAQREAVLACEQDYAELHSLLTNLPVLEHHSADELAKRAVDVLRNHPPNKLLTKHAMHFSR